MQDGCFFFPLSDTATEVMEPVDSSKGRNRKRFYSLITNFASVTVADESEDGGGEVGSYPFRFVWDAVGYLIVFSNPNRATVALTYPSEPYGRLLFMASRIFTTSS